MKKQSILVMIIVLTFSSSILPQSKTFSTIKVTPDSINLYLNQTLKTVIDSFKIINTGFDTLHYQISWNHAGLDTGRLYNSISTNIEATADSFLLASIFNATVKSILFEYGFALKTKSTTKIEYFVYEGNSVLGSYSKIFSRLRIYDSLSFDNFALSGPMTITLDSGRYYIIGISWDKSLGYHNPSGVSMSQPGRGIKHIGSFTQTHKYPTENIYSIFTQPTETSLFDMSLKNGFPLWLELKSDSIGFIPLKDSITIRFKAKTDALPTKLVSYFSIQNNDSLTPSKLLKVSGGFATKVETFNNENILSRFTISQNYPNPFNASTMIQFTIL